MYWFSLFQILEMQSVGTSIEMENLPLMVHCLLENHSEEDQEEPNTIQVCQRL